jgi:hypothetical protein
MTEDWANDPVWRDFAMRVRAEMLPQLTDSSICVSIAPGDRGNGDVKYWVELGASIMLDKPIVVVAHPGHQLPERLLRVADKVVYADLGTDQGQQAVAEALALLVGED